MAVAREASSRIVFPTLGSSTYARRTKVCGRSNAAHRLTA
jgi:hypothetical protein